MFIERAGVRLHFTEEGSSGPVLLMHTGGGGDGRMWRLAGYTDGLAGYRCVLFDHRGHGRSDCPAEVSEHALACYVEDVIAVLDHLGTERAGLVGYSDGATVAYAAAAGFPDRVAAVVGLGAVGGPDETGSERSTAAAELRGRGMPEFIGRLAASEPQRAPQWLMDNLAATPTEMFALELEGWAEAPTAWEDFPRILAPTLLICGEDEEPGAREHAATAEGALPRGRTAVLPGLGHLQVFWRSDLTVPLMRDFLADHLPALG